MTVSCQPLPRNVAEEMLQVVARALCDRPGDSPVQGEGRTRQMVLSTLGMAPRDGLEFMLATLAYGHFQIILDSMSDVFRGQADALKAKTKTTIVPLGRAMLDMIRELRLVQERPVVQEAEAVRNDAVAAAQPQQTAAPPPDAVEVAPPDPDVLSEEELATLADPRLGLPAEVIAWLAGTGPAKPEAALPEAGVSGPNETPPAAASPANRKAAARLPFNVFAVTQPSVSGSDNADLPAWEDDSKPVEAHIVSHDQRLAVVYDTLAQGRVEIAAKAKAASGD
jgi:hypothetical protein